MTVVRSAMVCTVHQILFKMAWDMSLTVLWISVISQRLPLELWVSVTDF